jgi:hypothetical protein
MRTEYSIIQKYVCKCNSNINVCLQCGLFLTFSVLVFNYSEINLPPVSIFKK